MNPRLSTLVEAWVERLLDGPYKDYLSEKYVTSAEIQATNEEYQPVVRLNVLAYQVFTAKGA